MLLNGQNLKNMLKKWVIDHWKNGIAVSTKMILIEVRRLAIELSITDFAGTTSWCERFMRRNGLCMCTKTTVVQKLPCEYERKSVEFHKYVINMRKKLCFEIGQLGNMDEVPLMFDVPSNKQWMLKVKTTMIKTFGNEKTCYTVVLVCCADGTKLPPLLIFKRKMLPKDVIPHGIYIHVHSKGWMDGWRRNEAVVRESVVQVSRWSS